MLRKFSSSRSLSENIKLGTMMAFVAGAVNVTSLLLFFAFTSNVTGHYAIIAAEVAKGNYYQMAVVLGWIFMFFLGSSIANALVINLNHWSRYMAHATPLVLEILCLVAVGVYGQFHYRETLTETEVLLAIMLFAMGLQNGLTASISNFAVKTTHLTGLTTDLGILFSMFIRKEYRDNPELVGKAKLLMAIAAAYLLGAIAGGYSCIHLGFKTFYLVSILISIVILYDLYELRVRRYVSSRAAAQRTRKVIPSSLPDLPSVHTSHQEREVAAY
jgi:uncharacterized membrane protein YoaK (UPF0700 family)